MAEFTMPSLGADMDEGTLLEWLVHPGDQVRKGDVLAVVDTSKSAVEVESFVAGVVDALLVEPGTTVPVGTVLATLSEAGAAPRPEAPAPTPEPAEVAVTAAPKRAKRAPKPAGRVHSPLVRRDAERLGVDLAQVHGTGEGGEVTRDDVRRHAAAAVPTAVPTAVSTTVPAEGRPRVTPYARRLAAELGVDLGTVQPADGTTVRADDVRGVEHPQAVAEATPVAAPEVTPPPAPAPEVDPMRATIAAAMSRSKREVPHYYLANTVDLSRALAWMHERNKDLPLDRRLLPAALVLKATALAVAANPALNGFWTDGAFHAGAGVHLGVAISLRGGGLVAPALLDADQLPVDELMAQLKDLVLRARSRRLRGRELTEPTITVTNLGDQGVEAVFGVIHAPQVALVGVGRVVERPWASDGMVGARPVTTMTLSADHRVTDGFTGARFLDLIDRHLQHPEDL